MSAFAEWVIVRIITDETGHPEVTVVGELFRGEGAETACRVAAEKLNNTSRADIMDVYLARQVGCESD